MTMRPTVVDRSAVRGARARELGADYASIISANDADGNDLTTHGYRLIGANYVFAGTHDAVTAKIDSLIDMISEYPV